MSFHPDKCKALSIYDCRSFGLCYYNIIGKIIKFCENVRDLGVTLSSNFKWDKRHDKILKKPSNVRLH